MFFWRIDDWGISLQKSWTGKNILCRRKRPICWLSEAWPALMPCRDEGISSRTTRGYWKPDAINCRGASWSELDDKEPHGALRSARGSERIIISWTSSRAHASSSICYSMV